MTATSYCSSSGVHEQLCMLPHALGAMPCYCKHFAAFERPRRKRGCAHAAMRLASASPNAALAAGATGSLPR